jgi:Protein of unknown function (DUF1501)
MAGSLRGILGDLVNSLAGRSIKIECPRLPPSNPSESTMLNLTSRGSSHTCDGTTRRDFLQIGALGAIGLGLPEYLAAAEHSTDPGKDKRACIMIFNLGAPSQLDTFDMKPEAPAEVRGPFQAKAIFSYPKSCRSMPRSLTSSRSCDRVTTQQRRSMTQVGRCCKPVVSSMVA